MKKKALLSEAIWVFEPDGPEMGPAVLPPVATNVTLVIDEGEPLPLVVDAGGVTDLTVSAAKPVASIAQLADYLVNGFWQYNGTIAHRFASNTITYNINALNSAEQFLAVSAMQAWHDVANINFVQTSGAANLTFSNSGSMQAYTSAAWYSSGAIAYANIVISSDWITNDGGAYDGKTGNRQLRLSDLHPRNRTCARSRPPGPVQRQRILFDQCDLCQRHLAIFDHVVLSGEQLLRKFVSLRGHAANG